jgi:dihydroneopterin aldolase
MSDDLQTAFDLHARAAALAGPLDRISLQGHVAVAEIGAFEQERGATQRLRFDIVAEVAPQGDAADDVDRILSYDRLAEAVEAELAAQRLNLLETLADRVARRILREPQARRVFLRVQKLDRGPGDLGVEIVRSRDRHPDPIPSPIPPPPRPRASSYSPTTPTPRRISAGRGRSSSASGPPRPPSPRPAPRPPDAASPSLRSTRPPGRSPRATRASSSPAAAPSSTGRCGADTPPSGPRPRLVLDTPDAPSDTDAPSPRRLDRRAPGRRVPRPGGLPPPPGFRAPVPVETLP